LIRFFANAFPRRAVLSEFSIRAETELPDSVALLNSCT
jgi:hypothetical protein